MNPALTDLERELITEIGSIYEAHGFKRVTGLIIGLLMTRDEPLCLDDITTLLGRSKGPISNAARELAALQIVRRVDGEENRRDYYALHPEVFFVNFKNNMNTVQKNRTLAERFLLAFDPETSSNSQAARRRLQEMKRFYTLMEEFYEGFAALWEATRTVQRSEAAPSDRTP